MTALRLGSLCSGVDGLALGVERALGARTVWQSEVDRHAAIVLAARWPSIPNLGDLRTVNWAQVEPVDVLCAGFPCQPVSQAGQRRGVDDARWLWDDITAAAGRMDPPPRLLLLENVAGLLTANDGAAMARVVHGLAALGYVGRWRLLRSSDVGAPHRRERIFIAAAHADGVRDGQQPGSPLAAQEPGRRRQPDGGHRAVVGGAAPTDPDSWGFQDETDEQPVTDDGSGADALGDRRTAPHPDSPPRPTGHAEPGDGGAPALRGGPPGPGGRCGAPTDPDRQRLPGWPEHHSETQTATQVHHQLDELDPDGRVRWGVYEPAIRRWEAIHGPAPRPRDDRGRLNPELPEWMMGLPAGWVTDPALGLPRTAQLRLIGNAVQPQVAELAARLLLEPLMAAEAAA